MIFFFFKVILNNLIDLAKKQVDNKQKFKKSSSRNLQFHSPADGGFGAAFSNNRKIGKILLKKIRFFIYQMYSVVYVVFV